MSGLTRRNLFVLGGLTGTAYLGNNLLAERPFADTTPLAKKPIPGDLFKLGVASGDPLPDSVVLWTRLAPDPLHAGGMPNRKVSVHWEIAAEERFRRPVQRGVHHARPDWGHSVHVDVTGLRPDTEYFYRFRVGSEVSPIGRTRTAPAHGADKKRVRFAYASCQDYQAGYYVNQRDIALQDIAFVAFVGDYMYEYPGNPNRVRQHVGDTETITLEDYRNRYAQYRTDEDLQAAHAACAWIMTLDDHEIDNNWAGPIPQDPRRQSREEFRQRRMAALRAWYEHAPVRASQRPDGAEIQIYRRLEWGNLARIHVLDTRSYRTDQPSTVEETWDPDATMTGAAQERWLAEGLTTGSQKWNLIANQVPMAQTDRTAGPEERFFFDPWDGYRVQQRRLAELFGQERVASPFVLTGDRHFTMACDLKADYDDPDSPAMAAELTGTSLTSGSDGDPEAWHQRWDQIMAEAPHWKYGDGRRGYVLCETTEQRTIAELRVAERVSDPDGTVAPAQQFVIHQDKRGIELA